MNTATATATQTRTSECTHCEELTRQLVALEDRLVEIHATALAAVSIEERRHAIAAAVEAIT